MSNDNKFIDGLMFKAPHERAPEYVKAKGSIQREKLIAWLQQQRGDWINFDVKESQQGKYYAAIDDWKPNQGNTSSSGPRGGAPARERPQRATQPADDFPDDSIPFLTAYGVF